MCEDCRTHTHTWCIMRCCCLLQPTRSRGRLTTGSRRTHFLRLPPPLCVSIHYALISREIVIEEGVIIIICNDGKMARGLLLLFLFVPLKGEEDYFRRIWSSCSPSGGRGQNCANDASFAILSIRIMAAAKKRCIVRFGICPPLAVPFYSSHSITKTPSYQRIIIATCRLSLAAAPLQNFLLAALYISGLFCRTYTAIAVIIIGTGGVSLAPSSPYHMSLSFTPAGVL